MSDLARFAVFMASAAIVFVGVLIFVTRKRETRPAPALLFTVTAIVVAGGILFARYGHILFRPPWWIYYGVPALVTFLLPPAVFRMTRFEILQYVPLALLMAPAIHIFSLCLLAGMTTCHFLFTFRYFCSCSMGRPI